MTATLGRRRTPEVGWTRQQPVHGPRTAAAARIDHTRAAIGALLTGVSVITVLVLYGRANDTVPVVAAVGDIPAGHTLTPADITAADLPANGRIAAIPASSSAEIVGQVALVPIEAGALINPAAVAVDLPVPVGAAVVAALVTAGQYPSGLDVGDTVRIVESREPAATSSVLAVDRGTAQVVAIAEGGTATSAVVVSLAVPEELTVELSSAGAAGRLSLAMVRP